MCQLSGRLDSLERLEDLASLLQGAQHAISGRTSHPLWQLTTVFLRAECRTLLALALSLLILVFQSQ